MFNGCLLIIEIVYVDKLITLANCRLKRTAALFFVEAPPLGRSIRWPILILVDKRHVTVYD